MVCERVQYTEVTLKEIRIGTVARGAKALGIKILTEEEGYLQIKHQGRWVVVHQVKSKAGDREVAFVTFLLATGLLICSWLLKSL